MNTVVYIAVYAGAAIFAIGCVLRIVQYARTPVHLRWELYPVPHEEPKRAAHGGSYFEGANWWTHRQHFNLIGELRSMVPEMVFLKGLWEFNRRLWYSSFPFHFGLYLVIASAGLTFAAAIAAVLAPALIAGSFGVLLAHGYRLAGAVGAALSCAGAVALLYRRTTSAELRNFTTAADRFNLLSFIVTFAVLLTGYALRPAGASVLGFVRGLITFHPGAGVGSVFGAGLALASALAAYIPFTHMAHFIAKYFTYHAVRWDDRVNWRGGTMEATMAEYIAYRPTWSAAHLGADGKRSWGQIVATNPVQGAGK